MLPTCARGSVTRSRLGYLNFSILSCLLLNCAAASAQTLLPPTVAKAFNPANTKQGTTVTLTITLGNPNSSALSNVNVSDVLPAGLTPVSPNHGTCDLASVTFSTRTLGVQVNTLAASSSCQATFQISAPNTGAFVNTTAAPTAANAPNGVPGTATLNVFSSSPPSISKAFNPVTTTPGGTSTLTLTISNPNGSPLTGVGFTDALPSGVLVASPNQLTSTCNGTATATAGSGTVSLTGGTLGANGTCTVTVSVTAANEGIYNNTTSAVTSNEAGSGNTASATLTVASPPVLTKSFSARAIAAGGSAVLTFTVKNPNQVIAISGVSFTDTLPAGLKVSTPNGLTGSCDSGTISAAAGSNTISLTGASLPATGSCTFSVSVTATATGALTNTTSAITANETVPGNPATATITVGSVFEVTYAANLAAGDSYINLTNTGENGANPIGPGLGGAAGNICVNVYAFDPTEELIACCSCLITPNGLVSLSVINDLISNTATGVKPGSVVVKTITTLAGAGGTDTSCTNSAARDGVLTSGLGAWRTTLHALPSGNYGPTEVPLTQSTLSAGELASVTGRCRSIIGNLSGFGICKSCRAGGLGAERDVQ